MLDKLIIVNVYTTAVLTLLFLILLRVNRYLFLSVMVVAVANVVRWSAVHNPT